MRISFVPVSKTRKREYYEFHLLTWCTHQGFQIGASERIAVPCENLKCVNNYVEFFKLTCQTSPLSRSHISIFALTMPSLCCSPRDKISSQFWLASHPPSLSKR